MNERRLHFLFVTDLHAPVWQPVLTEALATWGTVEAVAETDIVERLGLVAADETRQPVVILDASQCLDAAKLVETLQTEFAGLPVVVLTALPNLRLLRSVYRAGARDCLKMSLDARTLRQEFLPVVEQVQAAN